MHHIICRLIERIGDHAVTIAKNSRMLLKDGPDDIRGMIINIGNNAGSLFNRSIRSWTERNVDDANAIITEGEALAECCKDIDRHAMKGDFDSVLSASLIAGSLRRICEYSVDIAEHAINAAM